MSRPLCEKCLENTVPIGDLICWECQHELDVLWGAIFEAADVDWSSQLCEECGSTLGSDGVCHNMTCVAYSDVGTNRI